MAVADEKALITALSHDTDFPALVALALDGAGVVMMRALSRQWPQANNAHNLPVVVGTSWRGLRSYLDKALFVAVFRRRQSTRYPEAIRRAIIEGNFESVVDEHFWFLSNDGTGEWSARIDEFEGTLRLRDANVTFHETNTNTNTNTDASTALPPEALTVRCHFAVPLAEGRKSSAPPCREFGAIPTTGPLKEAIKFHFEDRSPFLATAVRITAIKMQVNQR